MIEHLQESDTVIIGGGIAGLMTAINLAPRKTLVITKSILGEGTSSLWAQGGIAAAVDPDDNPNLHAQDTIKAGAGLSDRSIVQTITDLGPKIVKELVSLGVRFDKIDEKNYQLGREGAHSKRRILKAGGDGSGYEIMGTLIREAKKCSHISFLESLTIDEIIAENNKVCGVIGRFIDKNVPESYVLIKANNLVLATGGLGGVYAFTTNPREVYGEGIALAAKVGAKLVDMEFVQFHPTALDVGIDPMPLATEAIRGEGGTLVNENGKRFMLDTHEKAELASRDIVSKAIFAQQRQGHSTFLNCTGIDSKIFAEFFPNVSKHCKFAGLNPSKDLLPITPSAHYHMGGILVDSKGKTSVNGMWACGEVAATGIHGANRLASNSILESLSFAYIIAEDINTQKITEDKEIDVRYIKPKIKKQKTKNKIRAKKYIWQLRSLMYRNLGITRNSESIILALSEIAKIEREANHLSAKLTDMIFVTKFIALAALKRKESRGSHFRTDYPSTSKEFEKRIILDKDDLDQNIHDQDAKIILDVV